jgi:hypothetical protein
MVLISPKDALNQCRVPRRVSLRRKSDKAEVSGILRTATDEDVRFIEDHWAPLLQGTDADDASWPWRSKLDDLYVSEGAAEHVVVVIDDRVQGTLVTTLPDATSGLWGAHALYVEYVVTAPWNRGGEENAQSYKAVGSLLLRHAALRSLAVGRGGCVALHSVPGAVTCYIKTAHLEDHGPEPTEPGLVRFLGDAQWAQGFLK